MKISSPNLAILMLLGLGVAFHAAAGLAASGEASAPEHESRFTRAFGDHAVFQQNMPVSVWGLSLPVTQFEVSLDNQQKSNTADKESVWRVVLDAMTAAPSTTC